MLPLTYTGTDLYKALTERKSTDAAAMLNLLDRPAVMQKIERILDMSGTMPKDFTLHDARHSFRVAQRMWALIPAKTKKILSGYELGMLLLSAYLHDIGMSPAYTIVDNHRIFLTQRKDNLLTDKEINEFQKWIDDDARAGNIDIRKKKVTADTELANYILSYYIRHRHNDWSGEWIKNNLSGQDLGDYPDWVDDLILVCKSHHDGLDHLMGNAFDPRPVTPQTAVHLRYLAMCLRVADVMEVDPERTPEVILQHRDIAAGSKVYWLKDQQFQLRQSGETFTVYARPKKAFIHKAVVETADQMETELRLCDELARQRPLNHSLTMDIKGYEWTIDPLVKRDIQPKDHHYEYIQGAFRPNTAKLLELLGGHQLYGNAIWAYRELIQNAFDAVKEQIAWELINKDLDPEEDLTRLRELVAIDFSLEKKEDGIWLVCKDQGVGMTKSIIENYFLQSGVSKRHEIRELERKCEEMGFYLGRTGQFGIGALSYFMLADKLVIKTQRALNTGYLPHESVGWEFEINGTHDFGELVRLATPISGTEIRLKLNAMVEEDIEEWDQQFYRFLKDNIVKAPCVLRYDSWLSGKRRIDPGWTNDVSDIKDKVIGSFKRELEEREGKYRREMVTSGKRELRRIDQARQQELVEDLSRHMHFLFDEGEIDDSIRYRIHIPYFTLPGGDSLCFLKETLKKGRRYVQKVADGHYWRPHIEEIGSSLKGIRIDIPDFDLGAYHLPAAYVELDIEHNDELALDVKRAVLDLDPDFADELNRELSEKIVEMIDDHSDAFKSEYDLLNCLYTNTLPQYGYWTFRDEPEDETGDLLWEKITYPALFYSRGLKSPGEDLLLDGKPVCYVSETLRQYVNDSPRDRADAFGSMDFKFDAILGLRPEHGFSPFVLVNGLPTIGPFISLNDIDLPVQWQKVLVINAGGLGRPLTSVNKNHPLFKWYDPELIELFWKGFNSHSDGKRDPDTTSERECVSFLICAAIYYDDETWEARFEQYPDLMKAIFARLGTDSIYSLGNAELTIISANECIAYNTTAEDIAPFLPQIEEEKYYLRRQEK